MIIKEGSPGENTKKNDQPWLTPEIVSIVFNAYMFARPGLISGMAPKWNVWAAPPV
jgi:hypothetical protein